VLPENVRPWTRKHLGRELSPDQFYNDPDAQTRVFNGEFGSYLDKALKKAPDEDTAIRMAAAGWYGGEGAMHKYDNPNRFRPNEPSFREYTSKVLQRSKGANIKLADDDLINHVLSQVGGAESAWAIEDDILEAAGLSGSQGVPKPVPEHPDTIQAQLQSALDPKHMERAAVLLTEPDQIKLIPDTVLPQMLRVDTPNGPLLISKLKAASMGFKSPQAIKDHVAKNGFAGLIGKVEDVGNDTSQGMTVQTLDPQTGAEMSTSIVTSPEAAQAQAQSDAVQFPGGQSQVVPVADALTAREPIQKVPDYLAGVQEPNLIHQAPVPATAAKVIQPKARTKAPRTLKLGGTASVVPEAPQEEVSTQFEGDKVTLPQRPATSTATMKQWARDTVAQKLTEYGLSMKDAMEFVRTKPILSLDNRNLTNEDLQAGDTVSIDGNVIEMARQFAQGKSEQRQAEIAKAIARDEITDKNKFQDLADQGIEQADIEAFMNSPEGAAARETQGAYKQALQAYGERWDAPTLALRDTGQITPEEADKTIAKEKDARDKLEPIVANLNQYNSGDQEPLTVDQYITNSGNRSAQEYFQKEKEKWESWKYLAEHPNFLLSEGTKNIARAVPKAAESLAKTVSIATELVRSTLGDKDADARQGNFYKAGEAINDWTEANLPQDPKLRRNLLASTLPDTLGQMAIQLGLGALTGGAAAPTLIGASMGAQSQYDEANEGGATPTGRRAAALFGGLAAVPDALLFNKWLKPLNGTEKAGFFSKLFGSVFKNGAKEVGEAEALSFTKQFIKNSLKSGLFEAGQEISENKINDLVAQLTFDPKRKVLTINDNDIESGLAGFFGGALGGGFETVAEHGGSEVEPSEETKPNESPEIKTPDNPDQKVSVTEAKPQVSTEKEQNAVNSPNVRDKAGNEYRVLETLPGYRLKVENVETGSISAIKESKVSPIEPQLSGSEAMVEPPKPGSEAAREPLLPVRKDDIEPNEPKTATIKESLPVENPVVKDSFTAAPAILSKFGKKKVKVEAVQSEENINSKNGERKLSTPEPVKIESKVAPEVPAPVAKVVTETSTAPKKTVITAQGTKAQVTPKVIDASDLLTSFNKGYPAEFQPRDRSRAVSEAQISKIAQQLEPLKLGDENSASSGRPLVVPVEVDGKTKYAVISGNGRSEAIRRAYKSGGDVSAAYAEFARGKGESTAKEPVYIGVLDPKEVDIKSFAQESNAPESAQMSATEQSAQDADKLTPGLMSSFVPSEDGSIHSAANRDFVRGFLAQAVPETEHGKLIDKNGQLSQEGVNRVRNAIFAKAYGSEAVERLAESTDSNVKRITSALLQNAGKVAELNQMSADGVRHEGLNIAPDLVAAMEKFSHLRDEGSSVDEYLQQQGLFGDDLTPFQQRVLVEFDNYKNSAKAISGIINNYVAMAHELGDPRQADLFGGAAEVNSDDIFRKAVLEYANGRQASTTAQTSLFDADQGGEKAESENGSDSRQGVEKSDGEKRASVEAVKPLSRRVSDERLTELASRDDLSETLPDVTAAVNTKNKSAIDVSREGINLVREMLGVSPSAGLTLSKGNVSEIISDLNALTNHLKENGYDDADVKPINDLNQAFVAAQENSKSGKVLMHVPDIAGALEHEETHDAGYAGISDETRRQVTNFRNLDGLSETYHSAAKAYVDQFGGELDSNVGKHVAAEEVFTHIADGNYNELGLTLDQATDVAIELADAYAKARMAERPNLTYEQALDTYSETNAAKITREAIKKYGRQERGQNNGSDENTRSEKETGSDKEPAAESGSESQEKERRTIKSAEKAGVVDAAVFDRAITHYETKSVDGNIREAQERIERNGLQNSIDQALLPVDQTNEKSLRQHGSFQMEVAQLLREKSLEADAAGDKNLAKIYAEQKKDIISAIAKQGTDAGQFIKQLGAWRVTDPSSVVEFVESKREKNGIGTALTADEQKKLIDLANDLQQSESKIAALEGRIAELESKKGGKRQTKSEKQVSNVLAKRMAEAKARLRNPVLQMVAWHGSPHVFDKFSMDKLGTGEGAQAYGHGLYFTDKEDVADFYRNKLSQRSYEVTVNGRALDVQIDDFDARALRSAKNWKTLEANLARIAEDLEDSGDVRRAQQLRKINRYQDVSVDDGGAKYKVDLKPAEDEYLLWDKPLSEQSDKVRKALERSESVPTPIDSTLVASKRKDHSGEGLYRRLASDVPPAEASEFLHSLGIRGIKYLDGSARARDIASIEQHIQEAQDALKTASGAEEIAKHEKRIELLQKKLSYNYVIFNDEDVEIQEVLRMAVPDLSLQGQILDDLSDVGASILYTGFETDPIMTPERFRKELIKEVGKKYDANWRQIHGESLAKLDTILKDLRTQNAIERIRAEKGNEDLSNAELMELVNERVEQSKARTKIRNEHRKLANEVLKFDERANKLIAKDEAAKDKQHSKVVDFVNTVEKLGLEPSDEALVGALMLDLKTVSADALLRELRRYFPELKTDLSKDAATQREQMEKVQRIAAESAALREQVRKFREKEFFANRGKIAEVEAERKEAVRKRTNAYKELINTAETLQRPAPGWLRTAAQLSRMAKVAAIQTTVTNLGSTAIERAIAEKPTKTLDIITQKMLGPAFKAMGMELQNEGLDAKQIESVMKAAGHTWWTPKAKFSETDESGQEAMRGLSKQETVLRVIDEFPEYYSKFFGQLSPDLKPGAVKVVDTLMKPLQMQEFFMRSLIANEALALRADMKGQTLSEAVDKRLFSEDDLKYALDQALKGTYAFQAKAPTRQQLKSGDGSYTEAGFAGVSNVLKSSGILDLAAAESAPFTGFMFNVINKYKTSLPVLAQARLLMKTGQKARALKLAGEDNFIRQAIEEKWTSRQVAEQVWGLAAFAAIFAMVRGLGDKDEWSKIAVPMTKGWGKKTPQYPDGEPYYLDIRSQPLLAPFFFTASKLNRALKGKDMFTDAKTSADVVEQFLEGLGGFSYRQSVEQNSLFNAIQYSPYARQSFRTGPEDSDRNGEKFALFMNKWLGNELGLATNFLQFKTIKDIAAQFDTYEQNALNLDSAPILEGVASRLPESKRIIKDLLKMQYDSRRDYATGDEKKGNQLPILKIFGFNLADGATLRPEPSQAEIIANKLANKGEYTSPILPDEKRKAAIKRDFERESDKLRAAGDLKGLDALKKKLQGFVDSGDLSEGEVKTSSKNLLTSDLEENFKRLSGKSERGQKSDAMKVWDAATEKERQLLEPLLQKKNAQLDKQETKAISDKNIRSMVEEGRKAKESGKLQDFVNTMSEKRKEGWLPDELKEVRERVMMGDELYEVRTATSPAHAIEAFEEGMRGDDEELKKRLTAALKIKMANSKSADSKTAYTRALKKYSSALVRNARPSENIIDLRR